MIPSTSIELLEKLEKIQKLDYGSALTLIYEWVKTGVINRRQFMVLVDESLNKLG